MRVMGSLATLLMFLAMPLQAQAQSDFSGRWSFSGLIISGRLVMSFAQI